MTLTLEIIGPQATQLGAAARKVFVRTGGTIGRSPDNAWVIPDPYISSRHACIHYREGCYWLEDISTNGVFLHTLGNRLPKGQLHALQSGEHFFVDAYEISATVSIASQSAPIPDDPFALGAVTPAVSQNAVPPQPRSSAPLAAVDTADSVDPLQLLGIATPAKPMQAVPRAADLAQKSPLSEHYRPPSVAAAAAAAKKPVAPVAAASHSVIPDDYDPLQDAPAPASASASAPTATVAATPAAPATPVAARPIPGGRRESAPPPREKLNTATSTAHTAAKTATTTTDRARAVPPRPAVSPTSRTPAPTSHQAAAHSLNLAALLQAAGVPEVQLTAELAATFGHILRTVVAGLMEVLRSREQIKNEFRMHMTTFKAVDNNPLKFSVNVEDALHNLLVKRNAAYLGPAEAFEDAFRDVRHHQMAMLAGMRVAYDAMLSHFDPDALQEHFNKRLKTGALLSMPAKLRYWELYREQFQTLVGDPETSFRELFGEEFAQAYEEQLANLKAATRHQKKTEPAELS